VCSLTVQVMCEKLKIKSTKDTEKLKLAKEEVYLKGFYEGVLEVSITNHTMQIVVACDQIVSITVCVYVASSCYHDVSITSHIAAESGVLCACKWSHKGTPYTQSHTLVRDASCMLI
jgi:hypothetical protein